MSNVTLEEAQSKLAEIVHGLDVGDEIVITENNKPVARIVGTLQKEKPKRKLGTLKGTVLHMTPDFDTPLDDFKEYMD